jgi:PAS domain S-box-containing protein
VVFTCIPSSGAESSNGQSKPLVAVIHCDYSPGSFWDKNTDRPAGFFVDIIDGVAGRAGLQITYICKNGWSEMVQAIESGEADLGALLKSGEREKRVMFSTPIDINYLSFFARSQSSMDLESVPQGQTVGVVKGSLSHEQLKNRPDMRLLLYTSYQDGLFGLLAGEISLFAGEESMILKRARETRLEDRIKKVGKSFLEPERGLTVKRDNVQLLELLNKALSGFAGSTEYQKIYMKWFGAPTPYWTGRRVLTASGVFLFIVVCGMALWRYRSLSKIHRDLIQQMTERKQVEQALAESEASYRNLFDSSSDGIFIIDPDGNFIDANRTAYERLGYTREEFLALNISTLDHPSFATRVPERFRQIREHGAAVFESGHLRKEGSMMPVEVNSRLLEYKGKQAFFSVIRDITERKRMEEDLRSNRDFVSSIIDTVDEAFIVVDRDYRITMANTAYGIQANMAVREIMGKHCYEISHQSSRPCYEAGEECSVRHCFETGEPHACLHKHPHKDGCMLYVETKAFPLRDDAGNVTAVIEVINNITDKHLLEEQLLRSQKLEAVGLLAGGIAHDFNNLLQGIFGYISMAKMSLDQKEESLDMLEQAEKALHMSVNLTTQLLTFSKGGNPVRKKIMIGPVIENAVKFALSGSRVDYSIKTDGALGMVEVDEGQISQVIQNIMLNAAQSMPLGGTVSVVVKNVHASEKGLPATLPKGNYIEISIKDNGVGIPEHYLTRIFDPYFTTKEKGSGLGLAMSYSIIKNHGGLIDVQSELGEGSIFFVYLPTIETMEDHTDIISGAAPVVRKGRVLVMDDEDLVRNIAAVMVRSLGHDVEVSATGEEAIATYRDALSAGRRFDVVILDLTIRGGMGGEEAIKKLLELDPDVKAVVSSGYVDSSTMSDYEARGFSACLTKPYVIETLKDTLNALLK